MAHSSDSLHHVVIIGGGFAGLAAARELGRAGDEVRVTLLDRRNHHLFQPLLYQVATAGLSPADISWPIRSALRHCPNVSVRLADVDAIDASSKTLTTSIGAVPYDSLVVATGMQNGYFGHDEWEPFAPGLKSLEDAVEMRRRVLRAFEDAENEPDADKRRELLTFVVIGGGPTGVELAGALGEITRFALSRDFRVIDPSQARIILLEGGPRILAAFDESLSKDAVRDLETLGVQVWTNAMVTELAENGVSVGSEFVRTRTILWAAGVEASPLGRTLGDTDRAGRVIVSPDLSVPGHDGLYVVGDLARVDGPDGQPVPGVAPAALQMGRYVAKSIRRRLRGEEVEPFHYVDKGMMATIGRRSAVAEVAGRRFSGFLAWILWTGIHIFFLIGFRNRLIVSIQWTWMYLRYRRGARLITEEVETMAHEETSVTTGSG